MKKIRRYLDFCEKIQLWVLMLMMALAVCSWLIDKGFVKDILGLPWEFYYWTLLSIVIVWFGPYFTLDTIWNFSHDK